MSEETEKKRKAVGQCRKCGENPEPGMTCCRRCLDKLAARQTRYRQEKITESLCIRCGQKPCLPERRHCEECTPKARSGWAAYMRGWQQQKREQGICVGCGSKPAVSGKRKCAECTEKWNQRRKERRDSRKQSGICTECSLPPAPGHIRCEAHYQENRASVQKRRQRLEEAGLCQRCGTTPQPEHKGLCETCSLKALAYSLWKDRKRWTELLWLLEKQNRRCVYSGRNLVVGVNASVDHRIAASKGGTNDIANLQWVDLYINRMKWDVPEADFLAAVAELAKHKANKEP